MACVGKESSSAAQHVVTAAGGPGSSSLAAVILTKNEVRDVAACIQSCSFADAVIVLDSYSDDGTVEEAVRAGAVVKQRRFTNYADQRNAALELARRFDWVLMMDADERVPFDMAEEVWAAIRRSNVSVAAYRIRRKDFFFGKWLKRSTGYPTWASRVMRPTRCVFNRDINELLAVDGAVGELRTHFHHFPFSKGISGWISRHNAYSSMEARRLVDRLDGAVILSWRIFYEPSDRRQLLKQIFYKLPCRSALIFFSLYVFRLGFLDGWAGLQYCRLRAIYEYLIYLKVCEGRNA